MPVAYSSARIAARGVRSDGTKATLPALFPPSVHTGFDENGSYAVPVAVTGATTASVAVQVAAYTAAAKASGKSADDSLGCAAAGCHTGSGPDITPSGVGKHTDAEVLAAITAGQNPEGGDLSIGAANHSFAADAAIMAYLRSLAPAGTPVADE